MLKIHIKQNLNEIVQFLKEIDDEIFTTTHSELSHATIGEHTRHIIELFLELIKGYEIGIVNYDKRTRNLELQTSTKNAIDSLNYISNSIDKPNKEMLLQQGTSDILLEIATNYERELLYNLEHSIHHQALIKVAVLKYEHLIISESFGVAKSTLAYRKSCVQ